MSQFDQLRELLSRATPGRWVVEPSWSERCDGSVAIVNREHGGDDWDICTVHSTEANAELIVAAINALPQLLALAAAVESAPDAEGSFLEQWLSFAATPVGQECCGRGRGSECCGCPEPIYLTAQEVLEQMGARHRELTIAMQEPAP